jgi:hypothetical protein
VHPVVGRGDVSPAGGVYSYHHNKGCNKSATTDPKPKLIGTWPEATCFFDEEITYLYLFQFLLGKKYIEKGNLPSTPPPFLPGGAHL